jgi:nucleotide-binding universal stress UspA family protein
MNGNAATLLVETARATGAAALAVGARGHGRAHRALLGSVSGRVAASAPCPVVITPHDMDVAPSILDGPILCGVDGSAHAEDAATVTAAAAERLGCELFLVHVQPPAVTPLAMGPDAPNPQVDEQTRRTAHVPPAAHRAVERVATADSGARPSSA